MEPASYRPSDKNPDPVGPFATDSTGLPGEGARSKGRPKPPEDAFAESVRDFVRFFYNKNPFYVMSAALIFWGLRSSFDTTGKTFETEAFMIGLSGYTLILAGAACILIRLGQVWDDVRTILLLVVLMLLTISVSFDEFLANDSSVGMWYYLGGLVFAIAVSEATLRAIRLRLPWLFRIPYYLFLALFFLYPVAISRLIRDPSDPVLLWALFGFSSVAAVLTLTLLPAVWQGSRYVRDNGSPWPWPYYPWTLFFVLALAVGGRGYYLCCSFHFVRGSDTIFRPYFLAPFLLAVNFIVLEIALRSRVKPVLSAVLLGPVVIALLCITSPARIANDHGFQRLFVDTLGTAPLYFALIGAALFYTYAMLRRVEHALWGLTVVLAMLSITGTRGVWPQVVDELAVWPLFLAAVLLFAMAVARRESVCCALAVLFLLAGVSVGFHETAFTAYRGLLPVHLFLLSVMVIGAVFKDPFARVLQRIGIVGILGGSLAAVSAAPALFGNPPPMLLAAYPLLAASAAGLYVFVVGNREYLIAVVGGLFVWLVKVGWPAYQQLRHTVEGLDKIVFGVLFLVLALAISLAKAGVFRRASRCVNPDDTSIPDQAGAVGSGDPPQG
jgi:hypothetical protein